MKAEASVGPIVFEPVFQKRVWGGRRLAERYGKALPADGAPYGESWEVSDRDEAMSVVADGPLAGTTLRALWRERRREIFGRAAESWPDRRFPILIKILDCRQKLSLQVHPPAATAEVLGGEPKSEVWYLVDVEPGAELYVGLKGGIDRAAFATGLEEGRTADQVNAVRPHAGESIFIPSGRLHAIGGGFVIFEIQQNSDTTYRVFDWNRAGLDGVPRELHVAESLQCIDFDDVAPTMDAVEDGVVADCDDFRVEIALLDAGAAPVDLAADGECAIVGVATGEVTCGGRTFRRGQFFLVPAGRVPGSLQGTAAGPEGATILKTMLARQ
ncbi:class I mannose-6-phosphate isomerase [soil metagenome]